MVKTGAASAAKSSVFTLCTSIIISASQPRCCTAGKTRCDVDDDDGLSPAINNQQYHFSLAMRYLVSVTCCTYILFTRTHTMKATRHEKAIAAATEQNSGLTARYRSTCIGWHSQLRSYEASQLRTGGLLLKQSFTDAHMPLPTTVAHTL